MAGARWRAAIKSRCPRGWRLIDRTPSAEDNALLFAYRAPRMTTPPARMTFRIGTTFPSGDPVARFLTVVAMMSNDLLRLVSWMLELDAPDRAEEEGDRIFNFRLQASAFYEASTFVKDSIRRWPKVRTFGRQPPVRCSGGAGAGARRD